MSPKHPTKPNAFDDDDDTTVVAKPTPASVATPATTPAAEGPAVKRGRGRPPGPAKPVKPAQFPLRMHPDDHRLVKQLAQRDEIQMNELIYDALQMYCKSRAVHLKHAPGKVKR